MMYNNYTTINDAETALLNSGVADFYKDSEAFLHLMYSFNLKPNILMEIVEECGTVAKHNNSEATQLAVSVYKNLSELRYFY